MKHTTIKHTEVKHTKIIFGTLAIALLLGFSVNTYAAKSWGVTNEVKAKFTGTVVDIACQFTRNCPDDCGAGSRQLGLQTSDQGLIIVAKNLTLYSGAAEELYSFCGQEIEVDGLFTEHRNIRFFQVQKMRAIGGKWEKATRFHKAWAKENETKPRKAKRWYRKDERIKTIIERDGYLGLGLEQDAEYFDN